MANYIIGDVHGCYDSLLALLELIRFDEQRDKLIFVGDLVGKGPKSKQVVEFVVNNDFAHYVLGNHDLFALALGYQCYADIDHPYRHLLNQDQSLLDQWRLKSRLMLVDNAMQTIVVHAGLLPVWSIEQAAQYAKEVEHVLHGDHFLELLATMEGDEPHCWSPALTDNDRWRFILNACTRMRFCDEAGCLDFMEKDKIVSEQAHLKPWFDWPLKLNDYRLFFGHWAVLNGQHTPDNVFATDTGCVYGNKLTCYQITDSHTQPIIFAVAATDY